MGISWPSNLASGSAFKRPRFAACGQASEGQSVVDLLSCFQPPKTSWSGHRELRSEWLLQLDFDVLQYCVRVATPRHVDKAT